MHYYVTLLVERTDKTLLGDFGSSVGRNCIVDTLVEDCIKEAVAIAKLRTAN